MMGRLSEDLRRYLGRLARHTPAFRGKGRALRRTDDVLRRSSGCDALRERVDGVHYELRTRDVIDFNLLYEGRHDGAISDLIKSRLPAGGTLWDVGANVGAISLPIAAASPSVRVEAFEPSPPVRARLGANLALNPRLSSRVHVHACALSDRSGETNFYVSSETGNSGVGGLFAAGNRALTPTTVAVKRADDLIKAGEVLAPDVVKIDVEGFELEVLQGMEGTLTRAKRMDLVFEHEVYRLDERRLPRDALARFLSSLGFELFAIVKGRNGCALPRPMRPSDLDRRGDIYAALNRG